MRVTWLRHKFFFDQRLNRHPPSELGFGYESANDIGQGPPFFNVSGYTPIGGAITGPRNSTQTTFEIGDGASWTRGRHLFKMGGELRHTSIDMFQAIAPNAFYVFAGHVPDQQRHRQPAARRAGHLLSGPRRLQPRRAAVERRRLRAGRVAARHAG